VGTYKVFSAANQYLAETGREPVFRVQLVGAQPESGLYGGLFAVRPDHFLAAPPPTDLIVIPAIQPESTPDNAAFIPWIQAARKAGSDVASLCVGAFLLAETGLLNGRECTTHWRAAPHFAAAYPAVTLLPEKVITEEKGIFTSGGAYSFLNLVLYLVEKHAGREVSVFVSKLLEVDLERASQSHFTIFNGQKEHADEPIKRAQEYIEKNLSEKISVDQLAVRFAISRRNFERRFRKATANSPAEYLQRVKIEAAKKLLEKGAENITQIMYAVGYSDGKAFRIKFRQLTGLSPLEYKRKYCRSTTLVPDRDAANY
jgi:transcriptional regulator GlxA family with amidase domain